MSDQQHEGDKILHQDSVEDVVQEVLSESGVIKHISFEFSFDTPGLDVGVVIPGTETLAVGDRILDIWFELFEESEDLWDGTDAKADVGRFINGDGMYAFELSPVDLKLLDGATQSEDGWMVSCVNGSTSLASLSSDGGYQLVPAVITEAGSLKLLVNQTGFREGDPIDSTKGRGVVNLLILPAS